MKFRVTVPIIALNLLVCLAASNGVHAAVVGGGSLTAATAGETGSGSMVLTASSRHHSPLLEIECHRLFNHYRRQECFDSLPGRHHRHHPKKR
jgi:hypothetical protein